MIGQLPRLRRVAGRRLRFLDRRRRRAAASRVSARQRGQISLVWRCLRQRGARFMDSLSGIAARPTPPTRHRPPSEQCRAGKQALHSFGKRDDRFARASRAVIPRNQREFIL